MRSVLITGGASGLGKELVKSFINAGYKVFYTYFMTKPDDSLEKAEGIYCDLSSEESINNMLRVVENIDILVNNAAVEYNDDFSEKKKESFSYAMDVNLYAPFIISRELGKRMYDNKYGKIINISSNNSLDKFDSSTFEYDASKAGLNILTKILSREYAPYVITNAIAPGWILTERMKSLDESLNHELVKEESKKIILNRFAECEDIANLVLFLASDKSSYINGEIIRIDGGSNE